MPPPLCLLLLSHAALAALNGTHILSDTPSYLRTRGVVSRLFSEDIDVSSWTSELPPEWGVNVTAASGVCECSGRGSCPSGSTVCACSSGHSGTHCQYAGTAWVMSPLPASVPKARAYHTLTPVGDRLYMFGGMTYISGRANRLNDLHYLDTRSRRWTTPYSTGHWPAHRTSHTRLLYSKVHKQHHTYSATVAHAAEYAGPVETVLARASSACGRG